MQTVLLFSTRDSICQSWTEALEETCELIACRDEFDCITNLHSHPNSIILFHINSYEGDITNFRFVHNITVSLFNPNQSVYFGDGTYNFCHDALLV